MVVVVDGLNVGEKVRARLLRCAYFVGTVVCLVGIGLAAEGLVADLW